MYHKILIPLDGTAVAHCALAHAEALAKAFQAELIILRVVEPLPAVAMPPGPDLMAPGPLPFDPEVVEREEDAARAYVEGVAGGVGREHIPTATVVEWGGAAEEIVACADERQVDLIVMATHARGGLERWLLGSVAESVLHHTRVPILLVKPPARAESQPKS